MNESSNTSECSPCEILDYCEEIIIDGRKYHNCTFPKCGKTFRFKSEFVRHKVIHVVKRPFNCTFPNCKKSFKREDALKNHYRIHTGEMPYRCEEPECDMSFTTKAGLRYHQLKHKNAKVCTCSFPGCNKSFLTMAQLRQHENAVNYHMKVIHQVPEEAEERDESMHSIDKANSEPSLEEISQMEVESRKSSSKGSDSPKGNEVLLDEFFAQQSKQASPTSSIQWEMRDQFDDDQNSEISSDLQESFEKMVKTILKENNALKQRLEMCTTLMNLMQDHNELKQKLSKVSGYDEPAPMKTNEEIANLINYYSQRQSSDKN